MDFLLLLQAPVPSTPTDFQSWVNVVVGQFGTMGILVWHLWYQTSVAGPAKDKAHAELIESIVAKFDATIETLRKDRETDRNSFKDICRGQPPRNST